MNGFNEYRFWSPVLGQNAVRLSMFDRRGSEFFMILPNEGGKRFRETRASAIEAIETAISLGLEPGEVRMI